MYAMALMTFLLGNDSKLDRIKCLQLSLVHDLAEAVVTDLTPHDNVPEDVKHQLEDEAMKKITSHIGNYPNLYLHVLIGTWHFKFEII